MTDAKKQAREKLKKNQPKIQEEKPKWFQGTYEYYKACNVYVMNWVIVTAAEISDHPAKKAKVCTLGELKHLCKIIAKKPVPTPRYVISKLKQAIAGRKKVTAYFYVPGPQPPKQETHAAANRIYDEILEILSALIEEPLPRSSYKDNSDSTAENANSGFWAGIFGFEHASLTDDEEDEEYEDENLEILNLKDYQIIDEGSNKISKISETEFHFAAMNFFYDFHRIIAHCRQLWEDRGATPLDLKARICAVCVTDQAVQVIRTLEYDFQQDFGSHFEDIDQLYEKLHAIVSTFEDQGSKDRAEKMYMFGIQNSLTEFKNCMRIRERRKRQTAPKNQSLDRKIKLPILPKILLFSLLDGRASWEGGQLWKYLNKKGGHPISLTLIFSVTMIFEIFDARRTAGDLLENLHLKQMRKVHDVIGLEVHRFIELFIDTDEKKFESFKHLRERKQSYRDDWKKLSKQLVWEDNTFNKDKFYSDKLTSSWRDTSTPVDVVWYVNPWLCANVAVYVIMKWWPNGVQLTQYGHFMQCALHLRNFLVQTDRITRDNDSEDETLMGYLSQKFTDMFMGTELPNKGFLRCYMNSSSKTSIVDWIKVRSGKALPTGRESIKPQESLIYVLQKSEIGLPEEVIKKSNKDSTVLQLKKANKANKKDKDRLYHSLFITQSLIEKELACNVILLNFWRIHEYLYDEFWKLWESLEFELMPPTDLTYRHGLGDWLGNLVELIFTRSLDRDDQVTASGRTILEKVVEVFGESICKAKIKDFLFDISLPELEIVSVINGTQILWGLIAWWAMGAVTIMLYNWLYLLVVTMLLCLTVHAVWVIKKHKIMVV
ncbi:hypothetical protein EDC01DRAFT_727490 [Geopyxis carbonaria]|nr:hypothetical protein EDC01DRAFT_727490 [Geopyxis carbonaria]